MPNLIDHHLKVHGTLAIAIAAIIDDVLGPGTTLHVHDAMLCERMRLRVSSEFEEENRENISSQMLLTGRPLKLHGNDRTHVAGRIRIRIVIAGKTGLRIETDRSDHLVIGRVLAATRHPDLFALLLRQLDNVQLQRVGHFLGQLKRIVVELRLPVVDLQDGVQTLLLPHTKRSVLYHSNLIQLQENARR